MNVNKTEGCLWHAKLPKREEQQSSSETTRFAQLMAHEMAKQPAGSVGKPVQLRQHKQCYQLLSGAGAGIICEIETREGGTYLKVRVPLRYLCRQLNIFSSWLNAGLLMAGHNVVLEVVYDAGIS